MIAPAVAQEEHSRHSVRVVRALFLVSAPRFHDLDIDLLVGLPGARAHLQPVTNFRLELSQCFAAREGRH